MAGSSVPPARCTKNRKQRGKKQILVRSKIHSPKSGLANEQRTKPNAAHPTLRRCTMPTTSVRVVATNDTLHSPSYRSGPGVRRRLARLLPDETINPTNRKRRRVTDRSQRSNGF